MGANLFQAYLQPPRSVMDYAGDLDAADLRKQNLQQNALQLAAGRMKMDEGAQANQRAASLRTALLSLPAGATDDDRIQAMRATGLPEGFAQADSLEKGLVERRKGNAVAGKDEAEAASKQADMRYQAAQHHAQGLAYVHTPQDIQTYIDQGIAKGVIPMAAREQMLAKAQSYPSVEAWRADAEAGSVPMLDRFKTDAENKRAAATNLTSRQNNADTNRTSITTTGMNNATTRRGQDLTQGNANQAVTYQPDGSGGFVALPSKLTPGQAPVARVALDASGQPVQAKTGANKLSEDQGKATGWLVQANTAFDNMQKVLTRNPSAARPGVGDAVSRIPGMSAVGNAMTGDDRQQFNQATSSFGEAVLRAATGAGVNKDEALQKARELTPQFGDSDAVVKQKMAAFPVYIESLKVRAGPGAKMAAAIAPNSPTAGAAATAAVNARTSPVMDAADAILAGKQPKFATGGPVGWRGPQWLDQGGEGASLGFADPVAGKAPMIAPPPGKSFGADSMSPQPSSATWQGQGESSFNDGASEVMRPFADGQNGVPSYPVKSRRIAPPPGKGYTGNALQMVGRAPPMRFAYYDGGEVEYEQARREPVVGTKAPVRMGGTGGGLSQNALLRAVSAIPDAPTASPVNPFNPRSVMADRERRADLTVGGPAVGGRPGRDSIPAWLNNNEHVLTADEVTALGDGDNALGQRRLLAWRASLGAR